MKAQAPRFVFTFPVVQPVEVEEGPGRPRRFDEQVTTSEAQNGSSSSGEKGVCHGGLSVVKARL